jgi:hypothetical protein
LIIIVTPRMTAPVDDITTLPNPLASSGEPSAIDLILAGMIESPARQALSAQVKR